MKKLLLATILAVTPIAAMANNVTTIAVVTGKCAKVMVMDIDSEPSLCSDKVTNAELPNGRLGFTFTMHHRGHPSVAFSFFGNGVNQMHINADTAVQPIDHVNFTFGDSTDHLVAAGSCRFTNPYKGTPSVISCTADTDKGRFVGEFTTNGVAPDISEIRR